MKIPTDVKRLVCDATAESVIRDNLPLCFDERKGLLPLVESIIEDGKEAAPGCHVDAKKLLS